MSFYRQLTDGCFSSEPGSALLTRGDFEPWLAAATEAAASIADGYANGAYPFLSVAEETEDLGHLRSSLSRFLDGDLREVLLLGTGGSILGGWALQALCPSKSATGPRLHFLHSIDPDTWAKLLRTIDLTKTGVIVISKSGGTAETLAQAMSVMPLLEKAGGKQLSERVLAVSEPGDRGLRRLATAVGAPCLDHHPEIGGRYSVLSVVGAIPAILSGIDMAALRAGARDCLKSCLDPGSRAEAPPVVGAALAAAFPERRRINQLVLMPYNERLDPFGHWYRQLWAESLGKEGRGTTPIRAQGPFDQHSQLQLYLDGPADKYFTVMVAEEAGRGPQVDPALAAASGATYLSDHTLGDLLAAEARATAETLVRNGRPVRQILLDQIDEATLGALFMHYFLETMITAALIGVDPFGQPAVEESKVLARRYLEDGLA